ncbi:hypothetical protein SUGI_0880120 [Cryptomeria japonica]|uniref:BTB/POZ domain-containing protein At5g41330 n=1 Tax=Cryptomeria japonica TaxID=3369 RepID=UPI0024149378|nr:BTB/POZ domain-containing protein At5g41330 [Cryptomeria japonica]GLJ42468.1 hypothetical protein SUGI_0880120 [Cryptomeria japonica]
MPPSVPQYQGSVTPLHAPPSFAPKAIIAINVGGTIFQTSAASLCNADKGSILASLLRTPSIPLKVENPAFFDRDPELFAVLLSILRTFKKPASVDDLFSISDLIAEAEYYGVSGALKSAMAAPPLDGLDMKDKSVLLSSGRDFPSAVSADREDGSVIFSHGSKISVYDWALRKNGTLLTQFNCIDTLLKISPSIAVAGAVDFPGLHVYNLDGKIHCATVQWEIESPEVRLYEPTVQAAEFSPSNNVIFSSFESSRKNAHTILLIDVGSFRPMAELGRQIGFGGSESSPATKLEWIDSHNLLMSSNVSSGPFGYRSDVKLWDIRSQKIVWECRESNPGPAIHQANSDSLSDCFADVTVNEQFGSIFKLGVRNGGLFMADLRQLNNSNPWVALGDTIPGVGGAQNRILGYGKQVFVSRGGDIEAWCEVGLREKSKILRKNIVDNKQGSERITRMTAGGNRLFVARKGLQGVEVWDSLRSKAASNSLI